MKKAKKDDNEPTYVQLTFQDLLKPKKKKRKTTQSNKLSSDELEFISFSLDEHLQQVNQNVGCTWENNVRAEKMHSYAVMDKLSLVEEGKTTIDQQDFYFLEFSMTERCDFTKEMGCGESWYSQISGDIVKSAKILNKIRRMGKLKSLIQD